MVLGIILKSLGVYKKEGKKRQKSGNFDFIFVKFNVIKPDEI